jgi:hypothetical protein
VERTGAPTATAIIARQLAIGQSVMSTREIAAELRRHNLSFRGDIRHETAARTWLVREPCFFELERGH